MSDPQTLVITVTPDADAADLPDLPECPPHQFDAGYATPLDPASHDDVVPALWCRACGEIRAFKIPDDRIPEE